MNALPFRSAAGDAPRCVKQSSAGERRGAPQELRAPQPPREAAPGARRSRSSHASPLAHTEHNWERSLWLRSARGPGGHSALSAAVTTLGVPGTALRTPAFRSSLGRRGVPWTGPPRPPVRAVPCPVLNWLCGRWLFLAVLMAEASSLMSLLIFEHLLQVRGRTGTKLP